ncbi:MAG: metal-dependent hydrolase [Vicinamibacterales bacterium]
MDNICHTLVGAVCGEAGLKTRSRFASATLMIAANLPDIDVAVFATSLPSVAFRRGITHGILAQALLPPLLALVMWTLGRRRPAPGDPPAHLWWLVALSYLGVLSHVGLDYLNNYGVRLLMPLSGRWFYGDTLFIIDPWMWAVMGIGVWWSRRRGSSRPARNALWLTAVYVVLMLVAAGAARQTVIDAWIARAGAPPRALMVGPRPVSPLVRDVIVDAGDHYVTGTFTWLPASVRFNEATVQKNDQDPAVAEALRDPEVQGFLVWSRFPAFTLDRSADGVLVQVGDMRFSAVQRVLGRSGFRAETVVR